MGALATTIRASARGIIFLTRNVEERRLAASLSTQDAKKEERKKKEVLWTINPSRVLDQRWNN